MGRRLIGHGCLLVLIGGVGSLEVYGADPLPVQARVFDIDYTVSEEALPLDSVQLWYTMDRGEAWHRYGLDEDRQSPISFHAPSEGLLGFFVVLSNATGQSSRPPTRSTQPHFWAFVDYTPPVVQLHPARQTTLLGQRVLQIRWTAIDAHLDSRPVEIAYRRPPADAWLPVSTDPLANTGRYDWRLPEDVVGQVAVRVTVRDKGGHAVESEQQVCEITAAGPGDSGLVGGDGNALEVTDAARARAEHLFREGLAHRDRGEYRLGVARMREAVRLDPRSAEAFVEMAGMLYRMDDIDRALHAYEIALEREPALRSALQGAAMVDRRKRDYTSAAARLRTILRHHPDDAEVWMNLGDIAIFQGDEVMARECYTRATETDPMATQVIEDARKRLALMAKVSRTYR